MSSGEIIKKLQSHFDSLAQSIPEERIEFWFARDLQEPLGYAKWENFLTTIMSLAKQLAVILMTIFVASGKWSAWEVGLSVLLKTLC